MITPVQPGTEAPGAGREKRVQDEGEGAARAFEAILVQELVKSMRSSIGKGGLFGDGTGSDLYEGMFDAGLAEAIAPAMNLGLSEALVRQLGLKKPENTESPNEAQVQAKSAVSGPEELNLRPVREDK